MEYFERPVLSTVYILFRERLSARERVAINRPSIAPRREQVRHGPGPIRLDPVVHPKKREGPHAQMYGFQYRWEVINAERATF
jgi:hypothetical protein